MMNEIKYSFSSANTFPMKILLNPEIISDALLYKKIPSIHLQLNPTNKCNFKCDFCSCSERDKHLELSFSDIREIIDIISYHGCKSVTITGGGEPLIHKNINEIINLIFDNKIDIGIVTNGTLLNNLSDDSFDKITWIRISVSDLYYLQLRKLDIVYVDQMLELKRIVNKYISVDWSFSYVIGEYPDLEAIMRFINFANQNKFTHIRLVNDIFIADKVSYQMKDIKEFIKNYGLDDSIVNYQDRAFYTKGYDPCYISILKPVIGADGYIYPCCGTQYALKNPSRDYEKIMRMGYIKNLDELLNNQEYFNGNICEKCYYGDYNKALEVLIKGLKHHKFV